MVKATTYRKHQQKAAEIADAIVGGAWDGGEPNTKQTAMFRDRQIGWVTTYQSVASSPKKFLELVSRHKLLLVLDESHHLPEAVAGAVDETVTIESAWTMSLDPIVKHAAFAVAMSGTARREKGQLAFIRHEFRRPVFDIEYTRRDALDENAVLRAVTKVFDGTASYLYQHRSHEQLLSLAKKVEQARALRTAITDDDFQGTVLDDALDDLDAYRRGRNNRARMIVVCESVEACKRVADRVRRSKHIAASEVLIAVGTPLKDEYDGATAVRRFRDKGEGLVLVTCLMAHEGLDVPDCTHLVCLTNTRSTVFLEQVFARVTRFDRGCKSLTWEQQCAFIYAPRDPKMVDFLRTWLDERESDFVDVKVKRAGTGPSFGERKSFVPISCEPGTMRVFIDDSEEDPVDTKSIDDWSSRHPGIAERLHRHEILTIVRDASGSR